MIAHVGIGRDKQPHGQPPHQIAGAWRGRVPWHQKWRLTGFRIQAQSDRDARVRGAMLRRGGRTRPHRVPGSSGAWPTHAIRGCPPEPTRCRCSTVPGVQAPTRAASGRGGEVPSRGVWLRKGHYASECLASQSRDCDEFQVSSLKLETRNSQLETARPPICPDKVALPESQAGRRRESCWLPHQCRIRDD